MIPCLGVASSPIRLHIFAKPFPSLLPVRRGRHGRPRRALKTRPWARQRRGCRNPSAMSGLATEHETGYVGESGASQLSSSTWREVENRKDRKTQAMGNRGRRFRHSHRADAMRRHSRTGIKKGRNRHCAIFSRFVSHMVSSSQLSLAFLLYPLQHLTLDYLDGCAGWPAGFALDVWRSSLYLSVPSLQWATGKTAGHVTE